MKSTFLTLALLWATLAATPTFLILNNIEIRTSYITHSNLVAGDPIIDKETHEIILIDEAMIKHTNNIINNLSTAEWEWYIGNWAHLNESVSGSTLSDPILRWASKVQKLTGRRLK